MNQMVAKMKSYKVKSIEALKRPIVATLQRWIASTFLTLIAFLTLPCATHAQTPVLFPLISMFGDNANYTGTMTLTATNALLMAPSGIQAGTFYKVTLTGQSNPVVYLAPNQYLVTLSGVRGGFIITVPASAATLNAANLTANVPVFSYVPPPVGVVTTNNGSPGYVPVYTPTVSAGYLWQAQTGGGTNGGGVPVLAGPGITSTDMNNSNLLTANLTNGTATTLSTNPVSGAISVNVVVTNFDAVGLAQKATNGLGGAAFTSPSAYDAAGSSAAMESMIQSILASGGWDVVADFIGFGGPGTADSIPGCLAANDEIVSTIPLSAIPGNITGNAATATTAQPGGNLVTNLSKPMLSTLTLTNPLFTAPLYIHTNGARTWKLSVVDTNGGGDWAFWQMDSNNITGGGKVGFNLNFALASGALSAQIVQDAQGDIVNNGFTTGAGNQFNGSGAGLTGTPYATNAFTLNNTSNYIQTIIAGSGTTVTFTTNAGQVTATITATGGGGSPIYVATNNGTGWNLTALTNSGNPVGLTNNGLYLSSQPLITSSTMTAGSFSCGAAGNFAINGTCGMQGAGGGSVIPFKVNGTTTLGMVCFSPNYYFLAGGTNAGFAFGRNESYMWDGTQPDAAITSLATGTMLFRTNVVVWGSGVFTNGIATYAAHTPAAVTVGTSPFTFTNPAPVNLKLHFVGQAAAYSYTLNGVAVFTGTNCVPDDLAPTNIVVITYSNTPPLFYTNAW